MTYILHELQNLNSVRMGAEYTGTLRGAKTKASRDQVYQGTVLKITDTQGRTVSVKTPDGWVDYDECGEVIA